MVCLWVLVVAVLWSVAVSQLWLRWRWGRMIDEQQELIDAYRAQDFGR